MTTTRPGAWQIALGAISDAIQGFRDVPRPYVVVLIVSALIEFIALPYSLDPDAQIEPLTAFVVLGFMLIGTVLLVAPYIALVRYFLYGDTSAGFEPRGPILRVVGWVVALSFAAIVLLSVVSVVAFLLGSQPLMAALIFLFMIGSIWLSLRLSTFLVAVTFDEPVSLRARFAETSGHAFFIFRTVLASAVVLIPYVLAVAALQFGIFGADSFASDAVIPPPSLGQRLLDALTTGVLSAAYFGYISALYTRIFRAVGAR